MSRSRIVFFLIIGIALLVVGASYFLQANQRKIDDQAATLAAQATMTAIPNQGVSSVEPLFAGGKVPTDTLPRYVCAADAFASYYALQQMQVAGYDTQNGFHLGIVPFYLDGTGGQFDLSEEARTELLASGQIDCLFTTLDSVALKGAGVITAIVDESAGADQLWARPDIKTLNDLRDKRIIYADGSVGQFFALYTLAVAGLNPRTDVKMIPADSVADAVDRFNRGEAEAVSGWEPDIANAKKSNGVNLLGSDKLRVIIDVIVTSRQAINTKSDTVQAFHNAWFRTLKAQFEDFPTAAKQIAQWGNNDWSGISAANAETELGKSLQNIAQAGLTQNTAVMNDITRLIDRLNAAQRVWAAFGQSIYSGDVTKLVDPRFVRRSATINTLATSSTPRNTTFLLASRPDFQALAPEQGETLALLPCRKFDFLPESAELTSESRRLLDTCVIPVLESSTGIYLRVVGSAAWPKNDPPYTEQDILSVAQERAKAVVDYLVSKGLDQRRFSVSAVLPPEERRNIEDGLEQSKDRYVEMTLITVGR